MTQTALADITPEPWAEFVMVGPELAQKWLGRNTHNRPLNLNSVVAAYARNMTAGAWWETGEAIKFSPSGELLDGQHRLHAIIKTGVTLRLLAVYGIQPAAQEVMDSGKVRSLSDALSLRGFKRASDLAAAAKATLNDCGLSRASMKITHTEGLEVIESDPTIRWIVNDVVPALDLGSILTRTVAFYCYWRLNQVDPEDTAEFFNALSSLANLPPGSPILALNRRLTAVDRKTRSQWAFREEAIACTFSAWNAWRRKESRQKIQINRGEYGRIHIPEPK